MIHFKINTTHIARVNRLDKTAFEVFCLNFSNQTFQTGSACSVIIEKKSLQKSSVFL